MYASMEPPCEHGGVLVRARGDSVATAKLQWSRRVNTAECGMGRNTPDRKRLASMEPPCEHGGVLSHRC